MQYYVERPYCFVLLPNPSSVVSAPYRGHVLQPSFGTSAAPHRGHALQPSFGASVAPYSGHVLHPSFEASAAPTSFPPYHRHPQYPASVPPTHYRLHSPQYHRYPQYPAYVPPTHYNLTAPAHQPVMVPPRQRRANIPPRLRRANIPPRQRRAYSVLQGDEYGAAPPLLYVDRVQPQPSEEAEIMTLEVNDVTQIGGNPTAHNALESMPSIMHSLEDDAVDCVICMDEMCTQDETEITKLPCNHLFHKNCVDLWLSSNSTCPLCRFKLPVNEQQIKLDRE